MEEIDPRLAKSIADRAERLADFGNEQFMSMSNWLMASNFAINAGALIAAFPLANTNDAAKIALCLFGIGMICGMLNGFAIQQLQALRHGPTEERVLMLRRAEVQGQIDYVALEALEGKIQQIFKWSWLPPLLGWLAGGLFVIGGGLLVWSL